MKVLMSIREASYHTGITEKTLWRAVKSGKLLARKIGARWYIVMTEIAQDVWVPVEIDETTPDAVLTRAVR